MGVNSRRAASRKVLLIGWDAADWKVIHPLLAAGRMPNLRRLVERGASGPIATIHPPLSPMLWTSIATGKRPFQHGILGFSEPSPDGRAILPVTNLSRTAKALWNILHQNDLSSIVVGWWPSHPAEPIHGAMISDQFHRAAGPLRAGDLTEAEAGWPMLADSIHPPELRDTIAGLRLHPDLLTPEMVEPFVPLAREIDQDADKRLGLLVRTLAEASSVHAASMWLIGNREWDFFAVYHDAIDHFCHGFMRYHPPRQRQVSERDFELYRNVVAAAYQLHDRMLGELLAKTAAETTVILISDHGFHPDHLRPASIPDFPAGPAIEHRDFGVLALAGPRIKGGETVGGASILDIAPTILSIFGLPVGEDMDGKALTQAFADPPAIDFIPSWELVPGADGSHPPHTRIDPLAAQSALEQMIALGYIERPDADREFAVRKTIRELQYNLAESYQDAGRQPEARAILAELHAAEPEDPRFTLKLFVSYQALGRIEEMRRLVEDLDRRQPSPSVEYLKVQVRIADKRYAEALSGLERMDQNQPGILLQMADVNLRLRRWQSARELYARALAIDPDRVEAYLGLCRIALGRREFDAAAEFALEALDRADQYPLAHFLLARALAGIGEAVRAADAFRAAIALNPNFPSAHLRLALLLERLGEDASARQHRRIAQEMRSDAAPRSKELREKAATMVLVESNGHGDGLPLSESLVIVTGLPRSGTSMLMQMLAAGGVEVVSDGIRAADDDNPRGYLEFERVKDLLKDSAWIREVRGKAIKIVAPLLAGVPADLASKVILLDRDLDEVLDSQDRMLLRRRKPLPSPERRALLKAEYTRMLARAEALLLRRPNTQMMVVKYRDAVSDSGAVAARLNQFLGGGLDVAGMAAAVEPSLHRNRQ